MTPNPAAGPPRNALLAGLPAEELDALRPHLARVSLVNGQVLYERGEAIEHVYFLEHGLASLVTGTGPDEMGAEVGVVGCEGLIGVPALLDDAPVSFYRTLIQMPGSGLRVPVGALRHGLEQMPGLRRLCLRYVQALLTQVSQTAACNGRHLLAGRLARWLLMSHDRGDGDELALTQEFLSLMLAVRRSGVTVATQELERAGLIRNARGRVAVVDRAGLERASCDCYRLVRDEYDRLLACA